MKEHNFYGSAIVKCLVLVTVLGLCSCKQGQTSQSSDSPEAGSSPVTTSVSNAAVLSQSNTQGLNYPLHTMAADKIDVSAFEIETRYIDNSDLSLVLQKRPDLTNTVEQSKAALAKAATNTPVAMLSTDDKNAIRRLLQRIPGIKSVIPFGTLKEDPFLKMFNVYVLTSTDSDYQVHLMKVKPDQPWEILVKYPSWR